MKTLIVFLVWLSACLLPFLKPAFERVNDWYYKIGQDKL